MGLLIVMIVGGIIGFLASLILINKEGLFADVIIGILGSIIGLWIFADILGLGTSESSSVSILNILWGIIGSILLIFGIEVLSSEPDEITEKHRKTTHAQGIAHDFKRKNDLNKK